MSEAKRGVVDRMDHYFRRTDTVLAQAVGLVSTQAGDSYLNSDTKRKLDVAVSVPAAVAVAPLVATLGVLKRVEDGGSAFFKQERINSDQEGTVTLVKIRSMRPNSDLGAGNERLARGHAPSEDPRNTRLGSFMRYFQLEELPQLWQVARGKLSLVGIRPLPSYTFDRLRQEWNQKRYERWKKAYDSGPLGLSGVTQVVETALKMEERRYHTDVFYVRNASLGFDLYLLWKTIHSLFLKKR